MLATSPFKYCVAKANSQPLHRDGPATLVCKSVIDETHDTKTFVFEHSQNRGFDFKPGQYATFKFLIHGTSYPRAYSLSSTPTRPHNVSITVKRAAGGVVSNWLNDTVRPGTVFDVLDISGRFNFLDMPSDKPLFLSGGSGITPVMSMLQFLVDTVDPADIVFIHFAKTPKDIIFRDKLEHLARRLPNLKLRFVVDNGDARFAGSIGRLTAPMIQSLVSDLPERDIFMCGPEGFMQTSRAIAAELGARSIHEESFGEKVIGEGNDEEGGEVNFSMSGMTGECRSGETILDAAMNAGIWINSSCQQGVCGTCRIKITQGEVRINDLGGISQAEKDEGYVLACCSRPVGPISVEA